MSGADELADDTLRAIAEGSFPASDAESMALAAEVLRLRDRADAAHLAFVRIIQAASVCGEVDLAAVDATPVRALDVVEALVASWEHQLRAASQVPGLRARAEQAEAERDAAIARAGRAEVTLSTLQRVAWEHLAAADALDAARAIAAGTRTEGWLDADRRCRDAADARDAARARLRTLAGEG